MGYEPNYWVLVGDCGIEVKDFPMEHDFGADSRLRGISFVEMPLSWMQLSQAKKSERAERPHQENNAYLKQ